MTRIVRQADGGVSVDPTGRAAGRGTYICDDAACQEPRRLADAVKRALGAAMEPGTMTLEGENATT